MHYYEHHIGDFTRDTVHLSPVEECYYRRALDLYYKSEMPLSTDVEDICRKLRAITKSQRKAVQIILAEFFTLEDDGYHQSRCDREIAEYLELEPDREAKKENARERQRRARERRKELFAFLREHNIVPRYDIKSVELQRMVDEVTSRTGNKPVTRDKSVTSQPDSCDVTATQVPSTTPQVPDDNYIYPAGDEDAAEAFLRGLGDFEEKNDPRMLTWKQLGYTSIPEHWRQMALKDFPDLNEASLKALFVGCAAKCAANYGTKQSVLKWDAQWAFTLSTFADEKLARQKSDKATGSKPATSRSSKTNLNCNQDWNNQPPPDYADLPPVDVSDMEY